MKLTRKNLFLGVSAVFTVAITAPSAFAASQNWDGGSVTNGNWSTVDNWNGAIPGATSGTTNTDIATFNAAITNTWGNAIGNPIVVDANRNISGFNFTLAAGNFFIGSTAGNAVLLSSGGTTQVNSGLTATDGVYTINAPLRIQGANGTYNFTNNSTSGTGAGRGTLILGGAITGAAAGATVITLNGTNTNSNNISGAIDEGSATTLGITKDGTGTWWLSGANTYSGDTTITDGQLRGVVFSNSLTPTSPFGTSTIKLNGGTLQVRAAGTADASVQTVTIGNNVVVGGDATVSATQPTGSSTNKTMAMGTLSIGTNTLGFTQGAGYKLSFTGTTLTGNATFNPLTATTSELILGGVAESGGSRSLTKSGIGILTINGAGSFTGDTKINAGILNLTHASALQNSAFDTTSIVGGAADGLRTSVTSLTLGGLKGSNNFATRFTSTTGGYTGLTALTLNPGTGVTHTYSGDIGNGNGSMTLTKTGLGTQVLTGTNSHSGATQITAGTLAVGTVATPTGSINNSAVTVNGGTFLYNSSVAYSGTLTFTSGTLAGTNLTGSLGGRTIGANQMISPGNSPGTMATTSQTWANNGSYLWEINDITGTAGADPGWDLLSGTGALSITATSANPFAILITSLTLGNVAGDASNFNDALSYNWMIADFASITGFDVSDFSLLTGGFDNTFTGAFGISLGGMGVVPGDSSQIYLTYTAIPEPGAALLGGLGLLALLRRRRN